MFVLGLPRSGTSITTKIVKALGVHIIATSEEKPNAYKHLGEYHPNPTGFYEITRNPFEHFLKIAGTPYSGCKMIIPVQGIRWDILKTLPSKVIMLDRDADEIKESQEAFYSCGSDIAFIRSALAQEKVNLRNAKIDHIIVKHRDIYENTFQFVKQIADFINSDADLMDVMDLVDNNLHRHKKEEIPS